MLNIQTKSILVVLYLHLLSKGQALVFACIAEMALRGCSAKVLGDGEHSFYEYPCSSLLVVVE